VVSGLSIAALNARADAEAQRTRASGLGAFMATDLRKGLRSAGRLDLQLAADKAALDYYRGQDLARLPPAALSQRAKLLHAAGEDNEKQGDLKTAQAQFEEARRTTAALLAASPNDPQRLFDHAQSEYWVGWINWRNGDGAAAQAGFEAYARLADELVAIDPKNDDWQMETALRGNNWACWPLRQAGDPAEAHNNSSAERCGSGRSSRSTSPATGTAARHRQCARLARRQPAVNGDLQRRWRRREAQGESWPTSCRGARTTPGARRHAGARLGRCAHRFGEGRPSPTANAASECGGSAALALVRRDPANKDFAKQTRMFELFKVRTWSHMPARARAPVATITETLGDCGASTTALANDEIADLRAILLARCTPRRRQGRRRKPPWPRSGSACRRTHDGSHSPLGAQSR
jgi:hypothetical protein